MLNFQHGKANLTLGPVVLSGPSNVRFSATALPGGRVKETVANREPTALAAGVVATTESVGNLYAVFRRPRRPIVPMTAELPNNVTKPPIKYTPIRRSRRSTSMLPNACLISRCFSGVKVNSNAC